MRRKREERPGPRGRPAGHFCRGLVGWSAVAAAAAAPLAAQETYTFTFAPPPGAVVRTLTELRTVTQFTGFPALPDGATMEEERRIEAWHRAAGEENGLWLVEAAVDTAWGRRRLDQAAWRDVTDSFPLGRPAVALVSSQFAVAGFRTSGPDDGEVFRPVGAMVAGLDFAFPGQPVAVGQSFGTGGRIQLRVRAAAETGVAVDETLFGDLALTLDSVVRQDGDELAYLRLGGALTPRSVSLESEGGNRAGSFSGAADWAALAVEIRAATGAPSP